MSTTANDPLSPPQLDLLQTKLDNGLTVVLQQDTSTVLAAVNLWYNVGSRNESPDHTGFAHLFEHMMFQGSAHVKSNEHFAFLEKVGATLNATTSIDRTNYFEALPVEHLDLALWLEADRMGSLDVSQENLDNQIEVVKEEKRQRNDNQPAGSFFPDVLAALFPEGHPMHHAPIGSMEHLDASDLEYVQNFHKTYYGPNTAVLTVVSPLAHDVVLERIEHFFGGIAPIAEPPALRDMTVDSWPLDTPYREVKPDRVQTPMVGMGMRIPPYGHPDHDAVQIALTILGEGKGSRLAKSLTRDAELAMPSSGYVAGMDWDKGVSLAVGQFQCRPDVDPQLVIDTVAAEVKGLITQPPTEAELKRAMALNAAGWMQTLGAVAQRADNISRIVTKTGDANRVNHELDGMLAVTAEDVSRVASQCLLLDGAAIITYIPGGSDQEVAA